MHCDSHIKAPLSWNEYFCGVERVIWNGFEFFPLRSLPLSVIIPFFLLLFEATAWLTDLFLITPIPTNDPNSCRRGGVNEVYSGVSGPPVSSCFLCAYISWCFLLLLTFKAPAAQSGLMERRRHQISTHSPNNRWNDGKDSEILLDESIKWCETSYTGCMWAITFGVWKIYKNNKDDKTVWSKGYMAVSGEKQEGLGQVGARRGRGEKTRGEQWHCWHDEWVYRNLRCKLNSFFTAAPFVPTSLYSSPPFLSSPSALFSRLCSVMTIHQHYRNLSLSALPVH